MHSSKSSPTSTNMASKFVVAVALFAVCHSSVVDVAYRGKRSITNAEASAESLKGPNQASAAVDNNKSKAYGITDDGGKAYAKADTQDSPVNSYISIGQAQPAYYHVPAPATVVAYQQQYDAPPEIAYELPSSQLAQSSAITQGGNGVASSAANTNFGQASSNSRTQGSGFNSASSIAQTNQLGNAEIPSVIAAKDQGYRYVYKVPVGPSSASSNANVNGQGSAASYANVGAVPTRKSISWRFGTAYDGPAAYGAANNYGYGAASANSDAAVNYGSVRSTANVQNAGSAQSTAYNGAGIGSANSAAHSNGGAANANAIVKNAGYAVRSGDSNVISTANTFGNGSAKSSAINSGAYGLRSTGWGGRIASDAHSNGNGYAASSANNHAVNSLAKSNSWGSAGANAYSN